MKILVVAAAAIFSLSSCTHYYPAAISSASLGQREKPVMVTTGTSQAVYVFGFGPIGGNDTLEAAVENAKKDTPADTMINTYMDRKVVSFPAEFFPLLRVITTTVYGTLVKYDQPLQAKPATKEEAWDDEPVKKQRAPANPAVTKALEQLKPGDEVVIITNKGKEVMGKFHAFADEQKYEFWLDRGSSYTPIPVADVADVLRLPGEKK